MAKTKVGKFLKKNKTILISAGIGAAAVGAGFLVPGSGAAINKVAGKILGKKDNSNDSKVLGKKGRGGLFGTGILAGKEQQLENIGIDISKLEIKQEEIKRKIAEKAAKMLGLPGLDYDKARELLSKDQFAEAEAAARKSVEGSEKGANTALYLIGGFAVAKILKLI